jgi:hypothetical protein
MSGLAGGRRRIAATEVMTEEQASRILFLLDGGTIRIGTPGERIPLLRVPNAGSSGRSWFACVRESLFP